MSARCEAARNSLVYSHGGRGFLRGSAFPSESSLRALHAAGVGHLDLDLFWTAEIHLDRSSESVETTKHFASEASAAVEAHSQMGARLFVGHPNELRQQWREHPTVAPLRSWRHNHSVFDLSAHDILVASANTILSARRLFQLADELSLSLALDLKGGGRPEYVPFLSWIAREAAASAWGARSWVWVHTVQAARAAAAGLSLVAAVTAAKTAADTAGLSIADSAEGEVGGAGGGSTPASYGVRFGRVLPDVGAPRASGVVACAAHVHASDARIFAVAGPSVHCLSRTLMEELRGKGIGARAVVTWTVDSEESLWQALALGVRAVVSNDPLRLVANISAEARRCAAAGIPIR